MEAKYYSEYRRKHPLICWLKSYKGQKVFTTALFLLIPLVLLILFTIIPAVNIVAFSFQQRDQLGNTVKWIGLDNYVSIFTDKSNWQALANSVYYFGGSFVQLTFALIIATILCSKIRFANVFKGFLFFPYMMNGVAVSLIFRRFFQKGDGITNTEGTLNSIIEMFGGEPMKWLSNPDIVNFCLVFASIWRFIGFDIIMFIGAIQSISPDVFEAAHLDGANSWNKFRYIIFPSIRPIIALQLILAVKGSISVYDIPYVITGGRSGTSTFVIRTMETAFDYNRVGLASAMAVLLLLLIIVITIIQKLCFKERK